MTHTTYAYIAAAYLAIMLLTLLQRVIKSQRVYIYHLDSAKVDTFSLGKVKAAKSYNKFRPYQYAAFKKEMFLYPYEEMNSHFKLLIETFSYFAR